MGFEIKGEMTMQKFLDHFKEEYKSEVTMMSQGVCMLYSFFMGKDKREERMNMNISDIVQKVSKKRIPSHARALTIELLRRRRWRRRGSALRQIHFASRKH